MLSVTIIFIFLIIIIIITLNIPSVVEEWYVREFHVVWRVVILKAESNHSKLTAFSAHVLCTVLRFMLSELLRNGASNFN